MSGGKRRARRKAGTRKKPVPAGLKKWQAFRKKHPDLTIKQASRAYQAQKKKKKGRGFDEDEEDYADEFEGFGMLGGADPSTVSTKSSAWLTKNVKELNAYEKVGEGVIKLFKKYFPKKYAKHRKAALGAGIDHLDYVRFAKADAQKDKYGQALRDEWNKLFADAVDISSGKTFDDRGKGGAPYLSPRENILEAIGSTVIQLVDDEAKIKAIELDE